MLTWLGEEVTPLGDVVGAGKAQMSLLAEVQLLRKPESPGAECLWKQGYRCLCSLGFLPA